MSRGFIPDANKEIRLPHIFLCKTGQQGFSRIYDRYASFSKGADPIHLILTRGSSKLNIVIDWARIVDGLQLLNY